MQLLLALLGILLIVVVFVDALWTTVADVGGGPLTTRLARGLWSLALGWHQRSESHRLLAIMGAGILISAILLWILLLWSGYGLLFISDPAAVGHASSGTPADFWERLYFTGFTISTLGVGDYVPQGHGWRLVTVVASLSGLFLITLSITYLVGVLSAAAAKRRLAASIADLGLTPQAILKAAWNDEGEFTLDNALSQLAPMIELHGQRHLAYPVLHFFHSEHVRTAIAPRLAALDEALLVLSVEAEQRGVSPPVSVTTTRRAIAGVLSTLNAAFITSKDASPPVMELEETSVLRFSRDALQQAAAETDTRRRLMLAYVQDDGWSWDDVTQIHQEPLP